MTSTVVRDPVYRYISIGEESKDQWGWPSSEQRSKLTAFLDDVQKSSIGQLYVSDYYIGRNMLLYFERWLTADEEKILDDIAVGKYSATKEEMQYDE